MFLSKSKLPKPHFNQSTKATNQYSKLNKDWKFFILLLELDIKENYSKHDEDYLSKVINNQNEDLIKDLTLIFSFIKGKITNYFLKISFNKLILHIKYSFYNKNQCKPGGVTVNSINNVNNECDKESNSQSIGQRNEIYHIQKLICFLMKKENQNLLKIIVNSLSDYFSETKAIIEDDLNDLFLLFKSINSESDQFEKGVSKAKHLSNQSNKKERKSNSLQIERRAFRFKTECSMTMMNQSVQRISVNISNDKYIERLIQRRKSTCNQRFYNRKLAEIENEEVILNQHSNESNKIKKNDYKKTIDYIRNKKSLDFIKDTGNINDDIQNNSSSENNLVLHQSINQITNENKQSKSIISSIFHNEEKKVLTETDKSQKIKECMENIKKNRLLNRRIETDSNRSAVLKVEKEYDQNKEKIEDLVCRLVNKKNENEVRKKYSLSKLDLSIIERYKNRNSGFKKIVNSENHVFPRKIVNCNHINYLNTNNTEGNQVFDYDNEYIKNFEGNIKNIKNMNLLKAKLKQSYVMNFNEKFHLKKDFPQSISTFTNQSTQLKTINTQVNSFNSKFLRFDGIVDSCLQMKIRRKLSMQYMNK